MQLEPGPRLDTAMIASLQDLPAKSKSSLFDQLYEGFADKARAAQAGMRTAAACEDWAEALSIVHKHRSNSGFLGLARYMRYCGELETLAREACEGEAPAMEVWNAALDVATIELQPSLDALAAHLDRGRSEPAVGAEGSGGGGAA